VARALQGVLVESRAAVLAFGAHLLLVGLGLALAAALIPTQRPIYAQNFRPAPLRGIERTLLQPLANWDGQYYTAIATRGYGASRLTTAFWPLYPTLVGAGARLTGWNVPRVGVLLSNLALLLALVLLHRLTRREHGPAVATRCVWLMALFPTAFYFSAVFTEALFLLLSVAAAALASRDRWFGGAVAAALATVTRAAGVLVLPMLGLLLLARYGRDPRRWWWRAGLLAAAGLTPLLFLWHIGAVWGDPWLPLTIQNRWKRALTPPWETVARAWQERGDAHARGALGCLGEIVGGRRDGCATDLAGQAALAPDLLNGLTLVLFAGLAVLGLWRLRPAYSAYGLALLLLPLLTPPQGNALMSLSRLMLVAFPAFMVLALVLRPRWLFGAVAGLFGGALVIATALFSAWFWIA
jgi:hypothetical protein